MPKINILLFVFAFLQIPIVVFSQTQNVGVNTTSPVGKLHVKGSDNITQLIIEADTIQSNTSPLIKLRKSDGTDLMWIHSDNINNSFIGVNAGKSNNGGGGGLNNTFIGNSAGFSNTINSQNIAIGNQALYTQSFSAFPSITDNVAIGYKALYLNQPTATWNANENTAVGNYSLYSNAQGFHNTAIGFQSLYKNTGGYNVALGAESLYNTTAGYYNTASGYRAMYNNTTGLFNTASGYWSLYYNSVGEQNTAIGYEALFSNKAGNNGTAIGTKAMLYANNSTTPFLNYNVAIGFEALRGSTDYDNNTGNYNTVIGSEALWNNSTGSYNTANGSHALFANLTGSKNTALGYDAGVISNNLMNASAIGYNAKVDTSFALVLGGTGADAVRVGIGTQKPKAVLDINGDVIFRSADLTVANGVTLALDINANKFSYYRLAGPSADFTIAGISAGIHGRMITLQNNSGFSMQLNNSDVAASASNRIITGGNGNITLDTMGMVTLRYDGFKQKWIVNSTNMPGGGGVWVNIGQNIFFDNYVGLGTEDPTAPLSIETGLNTAGFSHSNNVDATTITSKITSVGGAIGTSSDDIFSLNAGGAAKLHVWPDGRVVIGDDPDPTNFSGNNSGSRMTSIVSKLTLETPINSTGLLHVGGPDSIIVQESIGGVSGSIGTATNHTFRINSNGQGRLHVLPDGNIVVGTNVQAPAGKFTVYTPNNTNGIVQVGGDGQILAMRIGGSSATIGTWTPHIMRIVANGVGVINIDPAGNIGIGISDPLPGYKVAINGSVKAKELVIETVGWPDYVFEKDYKLSSLKELENYIQQNKHLPNIPAASEIEEQGLSVGEIQKRMMEKIEELTLHIIELNKRIESLENNKGE